MGNSINGLNNIPPLEIDWRDGHPTSEEDVLAQSIIDNFDPVDYTISPSIILIPADGVTSATLTVVSNPADATAELLYGGVPLSVPLVDGIGEQEITNDLPGVLIITGSAGELANIKTYVYAGNEVQ